MLKSPTKKPVDARAKGGEGNMVGKCGEFAFSAALLMLYLSFPDTAQVNFHYKDGRMHLSEVYRYELKQQINTSTTQIWLTTGTKKDRS